MRTYLSGLTASGYAHPKIIPGAIYLDKNGNRVTVKELMFDRVYFIRDGYSFLSSLNVEIFICRFRRKSRLPEITMCHVWIKNYRN